MRTRQVSEMPRPQNTQAAANSDNENGNRPPAGNRRSNTSFDAGSNGEGSERECELGPTWRAREPGGREDYGEQYECHRARREHEHREEREAAASPGLQRPERKQGQRHAERKRESTGKNDPRPDDGERAVRPAGGGTPLPRSNDAEGQRSGGDARDGEQLDPEKCCERVVEKAVRDEAVAPCVPEVVPDSEPVILEQRALVEMGREVAPRRAEPGQNGRHCGGDTCGREGLAGDFAFGVSDPGHARGGAGARVDPKGSPTSRWRPCACASDISHACRLGSLPDP